MNLHYHPLLTFQHLTWHGGDPHGRTTIADKIADKDAGLGTWGVWMNKEPQ